MPRNIDTFAQRSTRATVILDEELPEVDEPNLLDSIDQSSQHPSESGLTIFIIKNSNI